VICSRQINHGDTRQPADGGANLLTSAETILAALQYQTWLCGG
jgi:hypothetical protein